MTQLSKSQINKLGERLRKPELPASDDIRLLSEFVTSQDPIRMEVEGAVTALSHEEDPPTARLKTNVSIIEKLRRQRTDLFKMQDIVGVRLITRRNRSAQDALVSGLVGHWAVQRTYDRRRTPQHGYRAVHVVVHIGERPAEIQVRTRMQHKWAELFEKLADRWGRNMRYGGTPDAGVDSGDVIPLLQRLSDDIDLFERRESAGHAIGDSLERLEALLDSLRLQLLETR